MTDTKKAKVITLEEIRERAKGVITEIPGWTQDEVIAVRLRAIDMTPHILSMENMPNVLRNAAMAVFEKDDVSSEKIAAETDVSDMQRMLPIIDSIVKECLIQPTWDDFQENYPLTMMQKMAIFEFAMAGWTPSNPFVQNPGKMAELIGIAKTFRCRPSDLISGLTTYEAYCFDSACMIYVIKLEEGKEPLEFKEDASTWL